MWKELAKKHNLKKIKSSEIWNGEYSTVKGSVTTAEEFEKAVEKGAEVYAPNGTYCTLCKKAEKPAEPTISPEAAERLEKQKKLEETFKQAYELREAFVQSVSNTAAKKKISLIAKTEIELIISRGFWGVDVEEIAELLSVEYDRTDESKQALAEAAGKTPEKLALAIIYCMFSDSKNNTCSTYRGEYSRSERLEKLYKFLEEFGYKISDIERALLDGSSEMYVAFEEEADDEEDDEDFEDEEDYDYDALVDEDE